MSDDVDVANDNAEVFLRSALENRQRMHLNPCGFCFYCQEPLRSGVLFCGSECGDDWQAEQKIKRIKGLG